MSQSRQLAAIMFTDIVGYTVLMGNDSAKALELVGLSKEIQQPLVEKYNGQWLKEMGDGALAKFETALDAVNCAIEIQEFARAKFDGKLRIGIHSGDVTIKENDVYGDGVNIASRLQTIADPGGIYISESIEKAIRGQSDVQAKYLGEIKLKNVSYDVRTYAVQGVGLPIPKVKDDKELSGHLWAEIQRRGIIRAILSYLLVSALLVLLWNQVQQWGLESPEWSFSLLVTVLGLGLPLSLYLAWNYERSPQGFVRTTSEASWQNPLKGKQKKPLTGPLFLIGLVLLGFLLYFNNQKGALTKNHEITESSAAPISSEKIIAVLPLDNFSPNKEENQYLCDGFMEEIINQLSKIQSLQVRSRSSVEQFREERPSTPEIGQMLRVSHLLEGSVQLIGKDLKVVVQLIQVNEDRHIWQDSYQQPLENVFEVYTDIANSVAEQLEIALTPEEHKQIESPPTDNLKAYDFYLRAKQNFSIYTSNFESAVTLFQRAEQEDPKFAEAIAGRAWVYWAAYNSSVALHQQIVLDSILILTNQALAIDSSLTDAYRVRSSYHNLIGDQEKSFLGAQTAFGIEPNNLLKIDMLGRAYCRRQDYISGLQLLHKAQQLSFGEDQLIWTYHYLSYKYIELNDLVMADHYLDSMLFIVPNSGLAMYAKTMMALMLKQWDKLDSLLNFDPKEGYEFRQLGLYNQQKGNYTDALENYEMAQSLSPPGGYPPAVLFRDANLGMALCLNNRKKEGEKLLHQTLANYQDLKRHAVDDYEVRIAAIHAFLGNKKEAYDWLRKSKWIDWAQYEILYEPWFSNIREEKEFKEIVQTVKVERRKVREEINRLKAAGEWEI